LRSRWRPLDWSRQALHVGHERGAFLSREIQPGRLILGGLRYDRLVMARHLEPKLDGACVQDEVLDTRDLPLPPKPADSTVLDPADPSLSFGRFLGLALGHRFDRLAGNRVDQTDAEKRRWIALGARNQELAGRLDRASQTGIGGSDDRLDLLDHGRR